MKLMSISFAFLALLVGLSVADTETYGWEGTGTVLGLEGTGEPPIITTIVSDPVHSGSYSLEMEDNSPSGTPEAFVAWIIGLNDGDEVTASFWRYDTTPTSAPSCRIWAHWNDDPDDLYNDSGSASGNYDYGPGTGWDMTEWTWTVVDGHTGLVIEARTYSAPGDIVWIDDLTVTAPSGVTIYTPGNYTAISPTTWGAIKCLGW